jgi:gas vesicle protein
MLNNRRNRSAWFATGLGLGILTGILCAPKSGRETRKAIAAGVDGGLKRAASLARDGRRHANHIVESGKKLITRKKEQVRAAIDAAKVLVKAA